MKKKKETELRFIKEKHAQLIIARKALAFQNQEKEIQATELIGHPAAIVESSDDAIISKSLDGTIKSWNRGSEKMFGYTAKEAIGKNISLIIPLEYISDEKKILEKIRNNEIIDHFETIRNKKNGEQFYVSLTISPLKDRTGNIIGVSKIARDITSRKKFEAELIQANKELAFQNDEKEKRAEELIIANEELVFQNKEKEMRAAELITANKELAFQNDEKEKRAAELIIANEELAFQNKEKEMRAAELIIANKELDFQNKEKEKRAAELIIANKELDFQNKEKEKRAAELIIANKELAFQNDEKEKRAAELIIANKELEQFVYIVSHDLQEPLRTISNFVGLIGEKYPKKSDVDYNQYMEFIVRATSKMQNLNTDLLSFLRIGKNVMRRAIDCNKILIEVIAELDAPIKESRAKISVSALPILHGNEVELKQLFQDLLQNAIKFRKQNVSPEIYITVEEKEMEYLFAIKDNGIGIEEQHKERIFIIFQRLRNDTEQPDTGIGLAICKKIVTLYNGKIWVESELGVGSTFYFSIPKEIDLSIVR